MRFPHFLLLFTALLSLNHLSVFKAVAADIPAKQLDFFEKKIRPVLVEHCYECHSVDQKVKGELLLDSKAGWMRGGESGEVIVPGKPDESLIIEALKHEFVEMPPKKRLPKPIVDDFAKWVKMGAPDPRTQPLGKPKDKKKKDDYFDLEQRKKFWSYQPVKYPSAPTVQNESWAWDDIDRFVLAGMEAKGLTPAEAADSYTLFRRLNYLITGLPPKPADADQFAKQHKREPRKAVEQAVDKLLASPHFGERWARHWMDLVRYTETKAFEMDYSMPYVYPYRDYLIRAFNEDVPYDQFILEALAGDKLHKPRINAKSGKNESELGPGWFHLTDGQHGPPDIHEDQVRIFDNIIDVVGKTFLGQTISCARCHDHKFDAITEGDFYSLYGILNSSRLDFVNQVAPAKLKKHQAEMAQKKEMLKNQLSKELASQLAALKMTPAIKSKSLKHLAGLAQHPFHRKAAELLEALSPPEFRNPGMKTKIPKGNDEVKRPGKRKNKKKNHSPRVHHPKTSKILPGMTRDRFSGWMTSGIAFGKQPAKPGDFIVDDRGFKAFTGGFPVAGSLSSRFHGSIKSPTFTLDGSDINLYVRGSNARVSLYVRHYELVGKGPTTAKLSKEINGDKWQVVSFQTKLWPGETAYLEVTQHGNQFGFIKNGQHSARHDDRSWVSMMIPGTPGNPGSPGTPGNPGKPGSPTAGPARTPGTLPQRSLKGMKPAALMAKLKSLPQKWRTNKLTMEESDLLTALHLTGLIDFNRGSTGKAIKQHARQQLNVPVPKYARSMTDGNGLDTPVYLRGQHKTLSKKPNPRRFMDALDPEPFKTKGSGRLEWAQHVASPENPLTRRVIVNRIWHHIFGQGIVTSVDDFGLMGKEPTHPELLDYLASKFEQDGWSIKKMIKRIALTRTFQLASTPSKRALSIDPKNYYLQHFTRRKLEAEAIRDTILSASGDLKLDMYGPSVPVNLHETQNSRAKPKKSGPLNGNGRRTIYLEIRRNFMPRFLTTFDYPGGNQTFGARNQTHVPAQSLLMMNDPFIHEQAKRWGERMHQKKASLKDKVDHMHRAFLGRPATQHEQAWAKSSLQKLAQKHRKDKNALSTECWQDFCHIMINRKEVLYVF